MINWISLKGVILDPYDKTFGYLKSKQIANLLYDVHTACIKDKNEQPYGYKALDSSSKLTHQTSNLISLTGLIERIVSDSIKFSKTGKYEMGDLIDFTVLQERRIEGLGMMYYDFDTSTVTLKRSMETLMGYVARENWLGRYICHVYNTDNINEVASDLYESSVACISFYKIVTLYFTVKRYYVELNEVFEDGRLKDVMFIWLEAMTLILESFINRIYISDPVRQTTTIGVRCDFFSIVVNSYYIDFLGVSHKAQNYGMAFYRAVFSYGPVEIFRFAIKCINTEPDECRDPENKYMFNHALGSDSEEKTKEIFYGRTFTDKERDHFWWGIKDNTPVMVKGIYDNFAITITV